MAIRPYCVICGFGKDPAGTFHAVRFADYAPAPPNYGGFVPGPQPTGVGLFCDDHLPRAMQLSQLPSDEALAIMGSEPPPPRPGGKAGIASLILGLLGLFTIIICIGAGLGPAALVAGVVSRRQARRHGESTPGTAIAGITLGVLCVILTIAGALWLRFLSAHPDPFACWPMKHHAGCY